jgi:hypothetical protein
MLAIFVISLAHNVSSSFKWHTLDGQCGILGIRTVRDHKILVGGRVYFVIQMIPGPLELLSVLEAIQSLAAYFNRHVLNHCVRTCLMHIQERFNYYKLFNRKYEITFTFE